MALTEVFAASTSVVKSLLFPFSLMLTANNRLSWMCFIFFDKYTYFCGRQSAWTIIKRCRKKRIFGPDFYFAEAAYLLYGWNVLQRRHFLRSSHT